MFIENIVVVVELSVIIDFVGNCMGIFFCVICVLMFILLGIVMMVFVGVDLCVYVWFECIVCVVVIR